MTNWEHCLQFAAKSDLGLRRSNNQDSMTYQLAVNGQVFSERGHFFMVADGMGAHAAGELASKMATDIICFDYFKRTDLTPPESLQTATINANTRIYTRGQKTLDFEGMGTTCTVLTLMPRGALLSHVGDSRAYRLRKYRFDQLTFDHSLVWEMQEACKRTGEAMPENIPSNIITRSLGPNQEVKVDLEGPFPLAVGDTFLLCSDGLSGPVEDEEMGTIVSLFPPEDAVQILVDLANLRGGPDNITVIVAQVTGQLVAKDDDEPATKQPAKQQPKKQPVHPGIWTALGVGAVGAVGALVMGSVPGAVVGTLVAAAAGVAAYVQSLPKGPKPPAVPFDGRPLGHGPYRSFDCTPTSAMNDRIVQVVDEVRQAAKESDWAIQWQKVDTTLQNAEKARSAGNWTEAIRYNLFAIKSLMQQLRSQKPKRTD